MEFLWDTFDGASGNQTDLHRLGHQDASLYPDRSSSGTKSRPTYSLAQREPADARLETRVESTLYARRIEIFVALFLLDSSDGMQLFRRTV